MDDLLLSCIPLRNTIEGLSMHHAPRMAYFSSRPVTCILLDDRFLESGFVEGHVFTGHIVSPILSNACGVWISHFALVWNLVIPIQIRTFVTAWTLRTRFPPNKTQDHTPTHPPPQPLCPTHQTTTSSPKKPSSLPPHPPTPNPMPTAGPSPQQLSSSSSSPPPSSP